MKNHENIWLTEYEGLLPVVAREQEQSPAQEAESRPQPQHEALGAHFDLNPAHLARLTPTAFFE